MDVVLHFFVCQEQEFGIIPVFPPAEVEIKPVSSEQSLSLVSFEELIPLSITEIKKLHGTIEMVIGDETILKTGNRLSTIANITHKDVDLVVRYAPENSTDFIKTLLTEMLFAYSIFYPDSKIDLNSIYSDGITLIFRITTITFGFVVANDFSKKRYSRCVLRMRG